MSRKIRIALICHLSNPEIRNHLEFDKVSIVKFIYKIMGKSFEIDYAQWNTNAITEFEKYDAVELHVISPHKCISGIQEFNINNIYYHFYPSEDDTFGSLFKFRVLGILKKSYSKSSSIICNFIRQIQPDLIHMIGAENPYYSESALSLPTHIPLVLSLQTLMSDPIFFDNYPISRELYEYRASLERKVILRADYLGTKIESFKRIILRDIKPDAKFLDMTLAVGEEVRLVENEKKYDFVYFAANISKAADYAIEAFALAKRKCPDITLLVVGGYDELFKKTLDQRILDLSLDGVFFLGLLPTHDDVINMVRTARYALLPLKIDLISGTIREAMANGLPVVSTITPATPQLNEKRLSILLSEKEDFQEMAENMLRLVEDPVYANTIRENAAITVSERYDNSMAMKEWVIAYESVISR